MQLSGVLVALVAAVALCADATVLLATTSVGVGAGTALALAGVGALALGAGLVVGGVLGRSRGRGRRAVTTSQRAELVLDVVAAADADDCALKFVCLLAAQQERRRSEAARRILRLVGGKSDAPAADQVGSPRQAYAAAASLGLAEGGDACEADLPACKHTFEEMTAYVREISA